MVKIEKLDLQYHRIVNTNTIKVVKDEITDLYKSIEKRREFLNIISLLYENNIAYDLSIDKTTIHLISDEDLLNKIKAKK